MKRLREFVDGVLRGAREQEKALSDLGQLEVGRAQVLGRLFGRIRSRRMRFYAAGVAYGMARCGAEIEEIEREVELLQRRKKLS